jgi:DNA-binding response OmpR family regulator
MAKVMLVEDDNNLREIYEARLLAEGYTIASAKDGEEALVVAKAEKPDLIISDVMMPKISGFEMLDILRNTEGMKNTKVIMLTALGQADDRARADSLGADRYLVKSQVTLEDIVKAAHELLEPQIATTPSTAAAAAELANVTITPTPAIAVVAPPTEPSVTPTIQAPTLSANAAEPTDTVATPSTIATSLPASETATSSAPVVDIAVPTTNDTSAAPTPGPTVLPEQASTTLAAANDASTSSAAAPTVVAPSVTNLIVPNISATPDLTAVTPSENSSTEPTSSETVSDPVEPESPVVAPEPPEIASVSPTDKSVPAPEVSAEGIEASADAKVESNTSAEEQKTVESQIKDFIKNTSEPDASNSKESAPAVNLLTTIKPTSPPNANTDQVMSDAIDTLIASTEPKLSSDVTAVEVPPLASPDINTDAVTPKPEPLIEPQTPAPSNNEDSDNVTIAHKKMIKPLEATNDKPNLTELLAQEEAKNIINGNAPVIVGAPTSPDSNSQAPTPSESSQPVVAAAQPGNTFTPNYNGENVAVPETKNDGFDPNSIAL